MQKTKLSVMTGRRRQNWRYATNLLRRGCKTENFQSIGTVLVQEFRGSFACGNHAFAKGGLTSWIGSVGLQISNPIFPTSKELQCMTGIAVQSLPPFFVKNHNGRVKKTLFTDDYWKKGAEDGWWKPQCWCYFHDIARMWKLSSLFSQPISSRPSTYPESRYQMMRLLLWPADLRLEHTHQVLTFVPTFGSISVGDLSPAWSADS